MKHLLCLASLLVITGFLHAQKVSGFKKKTKIYLVNNGYDNLKSGGGMQLYRVAKSLTITDSDKSFTGTLGATPIILNSNVDKVDISQAVIFNTISANIQNMPDVLEVDVSQSNKTIYVYPWPYLRDTVVGTPDARNTLFRNNIFFFKIPDRTVVKLKYSDFHFGALALPIKVFLSSQADSLKNNTVFDANLNLMVGKKWGKEKFYHLPNAESGEKYFLGYSANFILGISKIELSDENTSPKITQKYTLPALSYGFAFGVHYKTIGIYMALGIDTPLSKYAKEWNFRNRPWLGFGLGLGL